MGVRKRPVKNKKRIKAEAALSAKNPAQADTRDSLNPLFRQAISDSYLNSYPMRVFSEKRME
jgi:hypothetical protein